MKKSFIYAAIALIGLSQSIQAGPREKSYGDILGYKSKKVGETFENTGNSKKGGPRRESYGEILKNSPLLGESQIELKKLTFLPIEVLKTESVEVKTTVVSKKIEIFEKSVIVRGLELKLSFVDTKTGQEKEQQNHHVAVPSWQGQEIMDMICKKFGYGPALGKTLWGQAGRFPDDQIIYILDSEGIVSPESYASFQEKYGTKIGMYLDTVICRKAP